jgi:hypothetical protein
MSFLPSVASTSSRSAAASPLLLARLYYTHLGAVDLSPYKRTPAPVYNPAKDVLDLSLDERPKWNPMSKRSGTLMTKIGMTAVWDSNGVRVPCTVLQVRPLPPEPAQSAPRRASRTRCSLRPASSLR